MRDKNILGVILGGGRGTRLWPLTKLRAKPAVPIAGKYRLIDIPLSNCLNSGINKIAVLTQFNSFSLHRHITQTYHFDHFNPGWVQILAASQTNTNVEWYQGTADAVRKQLYEIRVTGADIVLVLAGDHLYRMNYARLLKYHMEMEADITLAIKPVTEADASRFGILKVTENGKIEGFLEKPQTRELLAPFALPQNPAQPYMGSMGIYIFNSNTLFSLLENENLEDFGHDVIPQAMNTHKICGYPFEGYWEDIGTIRSFYDSNLMLTRANPPFNLYDPNHPIYTRPRFLPGSRVYDVQLDQVLLAEGCLVKGKFLRNAVIGIRSIIGEDVILEDSVVMGSDYYEPKTRPWENKHGIPLGIGKGSIIRGTIIDKNARIGENVRIQSFPAGTELDADNYFIRDGIVVIPKNATILSGTIIEP
ncbi:MAG: glucose-1-phosphate adenylyltransferase [Anaerolineales bacterium]|nr:glucose-1-phosphate adenylyltransferase [Anaerolineales bacterium]